ncbi:hypothetical protein PHJA_002143700 [Phtheirospermum japonicum]|uniref:Uncharacterized protein n=1 Tax=Phtheirospermum japonicum TaxID=374723 RepID=A0A830CKZ2_9LAMI|nr:hypothetical protein PHJA_002143700 [Phtheirospermum japonicum]
MYNKILKDRHLKRKALTIEQEPMAVSEQTQLDDEYVAEWVVEYVGDDDQENVDGGGLEVENKKRKKQNTSWNKGKWNGKKKGMHFVDKEDEWEDVESGEDEEEDRAVRYADDSNDDPLSVDEEEMKDMASVMNLVLLIRIDFDVFILDMYC